MKNAKDVLAGIKYQLGNAYTQRQKVEAEETVKEKANEFLKSIGYGDKRDYKKLFVNHFGNVTTWAKSKDVAKIAWVAKYGFIPYVYDYD